ncbi:inter-alpha-trypsin inhibitor heavy chain H3-like [Chanodichthys erythropterus]|uniref:inter-alpha-trypsin inhibitor heavy chain H3-like n=1 Tax=Chanodichthys erythropterus TaxID=933992 RepID=UPI00351E5B73
MKWKLPTNPKREERIPDLQITMDKAALRVTLFGLLFTCVNLAANKKQDIDVSSFHINSKITSRYATTVITSRVKNKLNESQEVRFEVKIPKNAFISQFKMTIDGKIYDGVVKEKEEAQQEYCQAGSRGESAGLVSAVGRTFEDFKTSVTVAALSKVTFELTYEELLKRRHGKYELFINAQPMQPVADFKIDVHIHENPGISFLEVKGGLNTKDLTKAVKTTKAEKDAMVKFYPTRDQQTKCDDCSENGLNGSLIIMYDVERKIEAGDLKASEGYFVHCFAPTNIKYNSKNVVFIIDRSGSMSGIKMEQTHLAMLKILSDLAEDDHFGLITFSDKIKTWKPELLKATKGNVEEAKTFVKRIKSEGYTDINAAVLKAVDMINKHHQEGSASILILLTDGEPNRGETDPVKIQKNVKKAIDEKCPLYCLGFGFDVNFELLKKLSQGNNGVARRIYEDSDADQQLQDFYKEVATPLLTDVQLSYQGVADSTRTTFSQYYSGSEIMVAGRIIDSSLDSFTTEVTALVQQPERCSEGGFIGNIATDSMSYLADVEGLFCQWEGEIAISLKPWTHQGGNVVVLVEYGPVYVSGVQADSQCAVFLFCDAQTANPCMSDQHPVSSCSCVLPEERKGRYEYGAILETGPNLETLMHSGNLKLINDSLWNDVCFSARVELEASDLNFLCFRKKTKMVYHISVLIQKLNSNKPGQENFTERLWAFLTVKQLLEKEVTLQGQEKDDAKKKALDLSLKYKFVTPLTSMVVTKPQDQQIQVAHKPREGKKPNMHTQPTSSKSDCDGVSMGQGGELDDDGLMERGGELDDDVDVIEGGGAMAPLPSTTQKPVTTSPLKSIRILKSSGNAKPLCYDVPLAQKVRLLQNDVSEFSMNGQLDSENGFSQIAVRYKTHHLLLSTSEISYFDGQDTVKFSWDQVPWDQDHHDVSLILRSNEMDVTMGNIRVVILHKKDENFLWPAVWQHPKDSTGILGEVDISYEEIPGSQTLKLKDKEVKTSWVMVTDYRFSFAPVIGCWLVPFQVVAQRELSDFTVTQL